MTKVFYPAFALFALCVISAFVSPPAEDQLINTSLEITVLDELGNVVPGVEVQLYQNTADYRQDTNALTDKVITNKKGEVLFKKLDPRVYFVEAVKGDSSNAGGAVATDTLAKNRRNRVNIIIE